LAYCGCNNVIGTLASQIGVNRPSFFMMSPPGSGPPSLGQTAGTSSQIWIDEFSSCYDELDQRLDGDLEDELDLRVTPASVSRSVTKPLRIPYGTGIDAKKTAFYRSYDVDNSPVLRYLRMRYQVDMALMMRLINAVIEDVPMNHTPMKPSRNEKRSRHGLVFWLDRHRPLVFQFLWSHPEFQ
jgi:hypothetical protein